MRTVEEQLADVLSAVRRTPLEACPAAEALGRTLAEPVLARVDIPAFDNSAMDGFAVRRADAAEASPEHPARLRVVADLPAGTGDDPPLRPGEAARIMTGSPGPSAADAVVPFEDTTGGLEDSLGEVLVERAPAPGAHIRRRGEDAVVGDEIVPAGIRLGPLQLGAIAAAGVGEAVVAAAPRVAIVSTGSELAGPVALGPARPEPLPRGMIPESNGVLLAGLVAEAGADVVLRERVVDDGAALLAVLARAAEAGADVVVMSGGVSAGAYEVVRQTLGGTMDFAKVAMQPGKPQGFGRAEDGTLLFGLPGNPVSVAVSFETFVRPALLAMQGRADLRRPILRLPAAVGWRTPRGRRQYLPAAIDRADPGAWTVRPATAGGSGSHLAGGLARAEAYAVVPAEVDAVAPGDAVDVMLLA